MRLYSFVHAGGTFLLPTKNATSVPSKRTARLKVIQTSSGPVVDINGGVAERSAVYTHSGEYLLTEAQIQAAMVHLEAQIFPLAGVLSRGSVETGTFVDVFLPPNSGTTPALGNQIDAYLTEYEFRKTSSDARGSKFSIFASFSFTVVNQSVSTGDWL